MWVAGAKFEYRYRYANVYNRKWILESWRESLANIYMKKKKNPSFVNRSSPP